MVGGSRKKSGGAPSRQGQHCTGSREGRRDERDLGVHTGWFWLQHGREQAVVRGKAGEAGRARGRGAKHLAKKCGREAGGSGSLGKGLSKT